MGTQYSLEVEIIHNFNGCPSKGHMIVKIPQFSSIIDIDLLSVKRLVSGSEVEKTLIERGKKFEANSGVSYVSYIGNVTRCNWYSDQNFRSDGRIMIDSTSFARIDNDGFTEIIRSLGIEYNNEEANRIILSDDNYFSTIPYVIGFSFRAKQWGRFTIDTVSSIEWREDAFDKLVLDKDKKEMIKALVEHQDGSFNDIIDGKGGGCIFLLHGDPGQGKTLTAETVSELLKRPLYSVSVGELGTDPTQLENRLREILDIATVWNATILIDEADVFLESRDQHDILRNAMVGVFLRLLEYHQGVLFLTTNRVKNIDRAFYSRISVAIKYDGGSIEKRSRIWKNLTESADLKLSKDDIARLSAHDINGRQIKNIIRMTQTLSKARNIPVTVSGIEKNIKMATEFEREMGI